MILDMNGQGTLTAETYGYGDLPYVPLERPLPVREEVIIRGSSTAGQRNQITGHMDDPQP